MNDLGRTLLLYVVGTAVCVLLIAVAGTKFERWRRKGWRE